MGLFDSLSAALSSNQQQQQIDPVQMDSLSQLLAQLQTGKGGSSNDYKQLMNAYNPKPQKSDYLSDLGDSLVQTSKANPGTDNFGTLGLALSGLREKGKSQGAAQQQQYQKSLSDMIKLAAGQREAGQKDTTEMNLRNYQDRALGETIRNNNENNAYHSGMLKVYQDKADNKSSPENMKDISPNDFVDVKKFIMGQQDGLTEEAANKLALAAVQKRKEKGLDWGTAIQETMKENPLEREDWPLNPFSSERYGIGDSARGNKPGKIIRKQQRSPSTGKVKTIYSDGTEEIN